MNLLDLFRAYPGGIGALAEASDLPVHTLYRLGHGQHHFRPVGQLNRLAKVLKGKIHGHVCSLDELLALWEAARVAHEAKSA